MNTDTVERQYTEPRLQAFEQVDKANADALWQAHDRHMASMNKVCTGIKELAIGMVSLNDASTILSALSAKLYEAGLNEWADEIDVIAAEVQQ